MRSACSWFLNSVADIEKDVVHTVSAQDPGTGKESDSLTIRKSSPFAGFSERYGSLVLPAVLFLALVLRVLALLSLRESIYFDFLLWDERYYHVWATRIANGSATSSSVYEFSPLPAYLFAFIYKLFSPSVLYVRILNIGFGVLTCYLVYLIGRRMGSRLTGLVACLIASLYEPLILYSIVPLKTSLAVCLFALSTYLFLAILDKPSSIIGLLLGTASGLLMNVRPNYLVVIPLLLLCTLYQSRSPIKARLQGALFIIAGLSLALAPFVIRNYRVAGAFALTTSQAGFNLYLGNNLDSPDPYYRPVPFASSSPFVQGTQFVIEASRRENRRLSPQEASSYWSSQVLKMAAAHPSAFLRKIGEKTLVLFNQFEACDHYDLGFLSNFVRFFKLPLLKFWLILPLGIAGMALTVRNSSRLSALSAVFLFYLSTLVVFFTNMRYRVPAVTILIPFAVLGIERAWVYVANRSHNKTFAYLLVALVVVVVEFLPVRGTEDLSAYYNTHAVALNSRGSQQEAVTYWERSSQMNKPFSAFANLSLASEYHRRHETEKAFHYLERIDDTSFAAAFKYSLIGDLRATQGESAEAASAYERSLQINSGQIDVRKKLIKLLEKTDRERASQEEANVRYVTSFYSGF